MTDREIQKLYLSSRLADWSEPQKKAVERHSYQLAELLNTMGSPPLIVLQAMIDCIGTICALASNKAHIDHVAKAVGEATRYSISYSMNLKHNRKVEVTPVDAHNIWMELQQDIQNSLPSGEAP